MFSLWKMERQVLMSILPAFLVFASLDKRHFSDRLVPGFSAETSEIIEQRRII
jgi:hypothetical protein